MMKVLITAINFIIFNVCFASDNLDVKDASLIIDENTKIVFSIPNDKLFISEDVLSDTDISELPKKKFIHISEFSKYKAYTFYIQKFTIKNSLMKIKFYRLFKVKIISKVSFY